MNNKGFNIIDLVKTSNSIELKISFDEQYKYFQGHFETFKLLPALIQIHLVVELYNKYFLENYTPKKFKNLKFVAPIRPNSEYFLKIQKKINGIEFSYFTADKNYSNGILNL